MARPREQRLGDIDPEHTTVGHNPLRQSEGGGATSAADIQHDFARARGRAVEQDLGHRREQCVLPLLPLQPAPAPRTIPIGDLVGVAVVGRGQHH